MLHKHLADEDKGLFNTINYMASQFTQDFTFFGFMPLEDDEYFGITHNNVNYAAIHISNSTIDKIRSDDEDKEKKQIQSGKRWLIVIYGSDNSSFMKRFDSKERLMKWLYKTTKLVRDDTWLWYNS